MPGRRAILLVAVLLTAAPVSAVEPLSLAFSGGVSNFNKTPTWIEVGAEVRTPTNVWGLAMVGGLSVNQGRAVWIFGGVRRDFSISKSWIVTPAFAVSIYEQGDGKDLGGPVEFRSALEIGYQWPSRKRLALVIYHLSNAGIYDQNPGMNSLALTYSFPLD